MGKKKKPESKGKGALKTSMKTEKKNAMKLKKELSAIGEEDIKSLIAKSRSQDKSELIEEIINPGPRSNFTLSHHPERDEFYLFGGEYFDGKKTFMYNDLFCYELKSNTWKKISCPNPPSPRCSHQAVTTPSGGGQIWIFGGEFASPSQIQFYHFSDLYVFHLKEKRWEQINAKGGPSARSGHRMALFRKYLVVFGGFHEAYKDFHYFNDVHLFDLTNRHWNVITVSGIPPCPRSGCQLATVNDEKVLLYGGYTKQKQKKDVDVGTIHSDMFCLTVDKNDETCSKWKWSTVKQSGVKPPPRCSFGWVAAGNNKVYMFGGVWDNVQGEEEIKGTLYGDLFFLDVVKAHWYPVNVGKSCSASQSTTSVSENPGNSTVATSKGPGSGMASSGVCPAPRRNAALVVKHNVLYVYGGVVEEGEKQLTLQDLHSVDLRKSDQWKVLIEPPKQADWVGSDDDSDEGGDEMDTEEEPDSEDSSEEDADESDTMSVDD